MLVYRIVAKKWSYRLHSPGVEGRWNRSGSFVIYTSSSRSLACLENIVHRSFLEPAIPFCCMIIEIPERTEIEIADPGLINGSWSDDRIFRICQETGTKWLKENKTPVLQVPSAIINKENNFVLSMKHPFFKNFRLVGTEDFIFDQRLK